MRDKLKRVYLISSPKKTPNITAKTPPATNKRLFDEPSRVLLGKPESQAPDAIKNVYQERHLIRLYSQKGFYVEAKTPVCLEWPEASPY